MARALEELQLLLAHFDESAFEALANRGLLRRAQKDLEKSPPVLLTDEPARIVVQVGKHRVSLDYRGPAKATCDCAAAGVCQHILSGSLWIQSIASSAQVNSREQLHTELTALNHGQLEKWAGKAAFRWAVQFMRDLDSPEAATISGDRNIVVDFNRPRFSCTFFGQDLDAAVVESVSGDTRKYVVAAALAYQLAHGQLLPEPERRAATTAALDLGQEHRAVEGVATHRVELRTKVLDSAERLILDCVTSGLSHLSSAIAERFTTLAVAAQGADLPRLALLLRRLADHADMLIRRDGGASEEVLLDDLSFANALIAALRAAGISRGAEGNRQLVGEARTAYENAGTLELVGLGAYPWRAQSGYLGLTLVFYQPYREAWFTWSEARPEIQGNFDPVARYKASGPWSGCGAPNQLTGKRFTLMAALANRFGRLSAAEGASAMLHDAIDIPSVLSKAVTNWTVLGNHMDQSGSTLEERDTRGSLYVLKPTSLLPSQFDAIQQELVWPLEDDAGAILFAKIPHSKMNAHAISRIEAMKGARLSASIGLVVRLTKEAGQLVALPISILSTEPNRHVDAIFFDAPPAQQSGFAKFLEQISRYAPKKPSTAQHATPWRKGIMLLERAAAEGLRVAERGLMNPSASSVEALETELRRCDKFGLSLPLAIWIAACAHDSPTSRGAALLRVHHAVRHLRQRL